MKNIFQRVLIPVLLLVPALASGMTVPYLTGRVTDNAQILTDDTRRSITEQLKAHEQQTTNQVAVLTVPSLEGESIEEYANSVFKEWKLGQKGKDNGILVLVAPNDRRMRIEVGYGLEGTIPDSLAGSIIRNVMTPKFKDSDFNGGISAGVSAILTVLEHGKAPEEVTASASQDTKKSFLSNIEEPNMPLTERILFGAFIFGIIGLFTVIGILTPGVGWFLYFFLIPFWAMFPIVVVGTKGALTLLITYLVVYPAAKLILRNMDWYKKAGNDLRTKGHASIGGFSISSGGSGSSWSSGGSSSGFSGGGGSSGGGGASGGW
ncbi:MAG TPA: YgcG family protein [Nitrospirota bacterium]|nr:YgcG family protein [Nitrospirota bacterium]